MAQEKTKVQSFIKLMLSVFIHIIAINKIRSNLSEI